MKEIISFSGKKCGYYGDYTYGVENMTVKEWGEGSQLKIGKYCSIARGVLILLGGNHRTDWVSTYPFGHIGHFPKIVSGHPQTNGDVIIGNDVWIGTNATIISGIKIGDGAVIATNSHVVKDVEPYSIVGGNPAKHIKYRFDKGTISELLNIKWWDWDKDKVIQNISLLCSDDIQKFIEKHKI